jgi:integrase
VRGIGRCSPGESARERTLNDDELRRVWRAAEARQDLYGYSARFVLLTAVRRSEAAEMTWDEVDGSDEMTWDEWTVRIG